MTVVVEVLSIVRAGFRLPVTVAGAQTWVAPLASAQAESLTEPAFRSAWVMVWLAVQVIVARGANDEPLAGVHDRSDTWASVTVTLASVTLPVLVAVMV